jgi:hypothetical protein
MPDFCYIDLNNESPIISAAIHNGHYFEKKLEQLSALSDSDRLREEDPYTGQWTKLTKNRIVANFSRFAVDLNRPREKCIYLDPEDAWGLNLWHTKPSKEILDQILLLYDEFYKTVSSGITDLLNKYTRIVILDLHSYNHRREGPDSPPADPQLNPEINVGTGKMDRTFWAPVVDRFIADLRQYPFFGRSLDVRENVKFRGGHFSNWLHKNFPLKVCCMSIEFKKFFMDEWTAAPDEKQLKEIYLLLKSTLPGLLDTIDRLT